MINIKCIKFTYSFLKFQNKKIDLIQFKKLKYTKIKNFL